MLKGRYDHAARLGLSFLIAATLLAGAAAPESPRAFQALVFAAMLAALWGAGARIARRLVPDFGPASHGVAAFGFAVGIAVVPATWLGQLGWLRPAPFLAWTALVFLLSRLLPVAGRVGEEKEEALSPTASATRSARIDLILLIAAGLAVAFVGLYDMNRLRWSPAGMHGFDDTSYHLSTVATWIRSGDLRMIRFSMGDPSTPFYPVLGEMSSWVLIAPFRDSDVAARWTELPFALFSFLAVAAIARRLGLSRRSAAFAAIAYAGIHHIFPILAVAAGNDASTAFFTLAGIDAALALARRPRLGTAVTAGAALGLLLATKYIGVLFAPVILAMLALAAWIERRRRAPAARLLMQIPARRLALVAALLAATMAVAGGYTYLRNAVTTGNPIFPAPVAIGGFEILPGWWGVSTADRAHEPAYAIDVWQFLTRRSKLFGAYFPFTLLPAALLAPLLALWRRRWLTAMTFLLAIAFFLQFLYLMQDHRDIRYFLPAVALAAVAFAWLLEAGGPRVALPLRALLLAWILLQGARRIGEPYAGQIAIAAAMLGAAWLAEIAWRRQGLESRPWMAPAAAALVAACAVPLGWAVDHYQAVKLERQPAVLALERLAGPNGAHVAYAGYNQPYLFFGSRFQNDLEIVPRNRSVDAQTYRWGARLANPYVEGSYSRWKGILDDKEIAWVVTVRSPWEDPEHRWVSKRTEDFALAYQDPSVEIWRVLETPPPGAPPNR
ncbi:MAG TPA: hypothetical protein VIE43_01625 [Thermoanaerobaculia bacterium]|jgi:hypothetical protein|nr:hypothetical protein [Thermoanaerobaculia bacterium]